MQSHVSINELASLRDQNPAWRLVRQAQAPFIISFLYRTFLETPRRQIPEPAFLGELEEFLQAARVLPNGKDYAVSAKDCLSKWASPECGFVRRTLGTADEYVVDLTPSANRAIEWVVGLRRKSSFVGTESRMRTILDLLVQIRNGTQADPTFHLQELIKQRDAIEAEVKRVSRGESPHKLDPIQVRDRLQQVHDHARALLSDLRDVEQNFRLLDGNIRKRIAIWDAPKGQLLSDVFGSSDQIEQTDQGRSFTAFWDFLMSGERQEEFRSLLKTAITAGLLEETGDQQLRHINREWLRAAEQAQGTIAQLSEQLRRFLDDRSRREHRRIMQLIQDIERTVLGLTGFPDGDIATVDAMEVELALPMERTLFSTAEPVSFSEAPVATGRSEDSAVGLHEQIYVDPAVLRANLERYLDEHIAVTLPLLLEKYPLQHGLTELLGYLRLATEREQASVTETETEVITWTSDGATRQATIPRVLFWR